MIRRIGNLLNGLILLLRVARDTQYSTSLIGIRNLREVFGLLRRVASVSQYPAPLSGDIPEGRSCFVLGNGPSLDADINDRLDIFCRGDVFCVNGFAEADVYAKIQPRFYVFADNGYWSPISSENMISVRNRLFAEMLRKTSWPLTVLVPFEAKAFFEAIFCQAKNIRLDFYNRTPLHGEEEILHILYDLGLGMPSAQNVLIPAIFLPLRLGYKKIILLGADHSWHETIALDNSNRVCFRDVHFYNEQSKLTPWIKNAADESVFTMDEIFYALALMFEGYWKIEKYARHLGAQIYNASSKTYVDAFERKPISEIQAELLAGEATES